MCSLSRIACCGTACSTRLRLGTSMPADWVQVHSSIWVRSNLVISCLQSIKVRKLRNRLLALRNSVSILSTTAFNGFSFALLTEESSTIYVDSPIKFEAKVRRFGHKGYFRIRKALLLQPLPSLPPTNSRRLGLLQFGIDSNNKRRRVGTYL